MAKLSRLRRVFSNAAGFTLLEALISVGILSIIGGLVSMATFQVLEVQRGTQNDLFAIKDLRHIGAVFATDGLNAVTTTLDSLANPVDQTSTTLHWSNAADEFYSATYRLSGDSLSRIFKKTDVNGVTIEGAVTHLAADVQSVEFSLTGDMLTLDLEIQGRGTTTKSSTLNTFIRNRP